MEGMAVRIGREIVFTNSSGIWELRSRRKSGGNIQLDFPESLAAGNWLLVRQDGKQVRGAACARPLNFVLLLFPRSCYGEG